jgi:hypothetical protein
LGGGGAGSMRPGGSSGVAPGGLGGPGGLRGSGSGGGGVGQSLGLRPDFVPGNGFRPPARKPSSGPGPGLGLGPGLGPGPGPGLGRGPPPPPEQIARGFGVHTVQLTAAGQRAHGLLSVADAEACVSAKVEAIEPGGYDAFLDFSTGYLCASRTANPPLRRLSPRRPEYFYVCGGDSCSTCESIGLFG